VRPSKIPLHRCHDKRAVDPHFLANRERSNCRSIEVGAAVLVVLIWEWAVKRNINIIEQREFS